MSAARWGAALLAMAQLPDRAVKAGRERVTVAVLLAAAAAGLVLLVPRARPPGLRDEAPSA